MNYMYEFSVPVMNRSLGALVAILEKSTHYSETRKLDPAALTEARLYPDMLPLRRQIQIACDYGKNGPARLTGLQTPAFEDTEKTMAELIARIQKTREVMSGFKADAFLGVEARDVTYPVGGGNTKTLPGLQYLQFALLPNFFFHVTTAYDILRHNGLEIGKRDFLGAK